MANVAIFASGNGSNFGAIASALQSTSHCIKFLVHDKSEIYAIERAKQFGIATHFVSYKGKDRSSVDAELANFLLENKIDLVVLAGFMRVLTPSFVDKFQNKIVNIHPSLLPKYPGTHGIEDSYNSGDGEGGITIHYVDYGVDTGAQILQVAVKIKENQSLEDFEKEIHLAEHAHYPKVVINLLNEIDLAKNS